VHEREYQVEGEKRCVQEVVLVFGGECQMGGKAFYVRKPLYVQELLYGEG
jgi:hypothetical protein